MAKQGFWVPARRSSFWGIYGRFFVLAVTFLLMGNYPFAAGQGTSELPFLIVTLKHISAEQGKKYLGEVKIGTVSVFPGSTALLVTAEATELTKAKAILDIVDSEVPFVVTGTLPVSAAKNLPTNEQIAAHLQGGGSLSIGDFSKPPDESATAKAIIDIHNGSLVVVAPASRLGEIISAIEQLKEEEEQAKKVEKQPEKKAIQALKPVVPKDSELHLTGDQSSAVSTILEQKVPEQKVPESKVVGPAITVQPYEPAPIPNGDEILKLDLPEKIDIVHLLGLVGPYLDLTFVYDPLKVKGEVSLLLQGKPRGPMKVKELYPLLETVLKFKGFVMTRHKGNLATIVPVEEALDIDPVLLPDKGEIEHGDLIITRVFTLKHIDTASAENFLTRMKLTTSVTPIVETDTLIVTAFAYRMARIEQLLQMVDQPGKLKKFRFRQLKYTMAETLAPKIKTLADELGTISITVAAEPEEPSVTTPSPKRAGESETAYRARLAREAALAAARRRALQAQRAARAAEPAEPVKPTVYLCADERTNRILMIGLEEQLADVDELIDTLDVEQQDLRTLELYKIKYVDAEDVKKKLEELRIISAPVTSVTDLRITDTTKTPTTQLSPTRPGVTRTGRTGMTTEEEAPLEEPQVVVVEATNSLLVNATAEQHAKILMVKDYVDSETEERANPYIVYPLENQDPEELAERLNKLVLETVESQEDKTGKIVKTTTKKLEEDIEIIADPTTYSLIVYASKKNQQWISSLIKELDEYRPQVLLDVTLVQITKDDAFNLDLTLLSSIPDMAFTSGQIAGVDSTIFERLLAAPDRTKFIDMKSAGGVFSGFYGDEKINALLTTVQRKKYGRVMARPKLLVNDGVEGMIKTTDITYVEVIEPSWIGVENPQLSEKVSFQEYEAGIELTIKPHISTGDMLRLEITIGRSGFTTPPGGEKPPDKAVADVTSTVTVPNGSTIILGGMEKIEHSKGGDKVPILGDLPIIGGMFRSVSRVGVHDKLYIFVKAHILRPGGDLALADLKEVSVKNRQTFEKLEEEMQNYEDWPGIKPAPLDPLKVLEAD